LEHALLALSLSGYKIKDRIRTRERDSEEIKGLEE
jgi:hypothetical protein